MRCAKRTSVLQQQVIERQRGEHLQAALFRIAELANTTESLDEFYEAVHRVVGSLLYARNFYIALLAENQHELLFPYSVDEFDPLRMPRELGKGLTEYVLRTGTRTARRPRRHRRACRRPARSFPTARCPRAGSACR